MVYANLINSRRNGKFEQDLKVNGVLVNKTRQGINGPKDSVT